MKLVGMHTQVSVVLISAVALTMVLPTVILAQQMLANFGSDTLTVEPGATTAAHAQNTAGLVFNGTYALGDTLGGTFTARDWSQPSYTQFGVLMTLTGTNPNLPFSVQFYDSSFNVIGTYSGTTVPLVPGTPTFVPLSLNVAGTEVWEMAEFHIAGTGDLSEVAGVQFTWDGGGSVNVLVEGIAVTAIPEPVVTSALVATGKVGRPFSYQITASNSPASYSAAGLPAGLSINSAGRITGTPKKAGTSTVTLSATNAGGIGAAALRLTVAKGTQTIVFNPKKTQKFKKGRKFTLSATASSKLGISFRSSNPRILWVKGNKATIRGKGKVTITASQTGDANYLPATAVKPTITIK